MVEVGRLKKVDLRGVWKHEADEFTPWLMDNSEVLGDALGLEIEYTTSEQQVGPCKVDIIGKDLTLRPDLPFSSIMGEHFNCRHVGHTTIDVPRSRHGGLDESSPALSTALDGHS